MGAVGTWAGELPQAPGEAQPREESGRLCGGWKGCACVRACVRAPGEAQPREESGRLCGGWKGCVCVCVCARARAMKMRP